MKNDKAQPLGNFLGMMQSKTGGVTLAELDIELAALVRATKATGKAGTLTLKIKVTPNAKAGVKIDDELTVKTPKESLGSAYFFTDENGALMRNDPNQTTLPLVVLENEQPQDKPKQVAL
jgi:hypothetical protein